MKIKSKAYIQAIQAASLLNVDEKRQLVKDLLDILTGLQPESFKIAAEDRKTTLTEVEKLASTEEAFAEVHQLLSSRKGKAL